MSTKQTEWEKYSAIRTKPKYILSEPEEGQYYFPISRQPICSHEIVKSLGDDIIQYILIQSLYRNLNEIAIIEGILIYEYAIGVATNKFFPSKISMEAFTIAIDEAYHAYRAADIMDQLRIKTEITPLHFPASQLDFALSRAKLTIPDTLLKDFVLVAVSIAESTIAHEAGSLLSEKGVHKTMREFTYDHMVDEARHSRIFVSILQAHWSNISTYDQEIIGKALPIFISSIFKQDSQKLFDRTVLEAIGLSEEKIERILYETYIEDASAFFKRNRGILNNITKFLNKCNVLQSPTVLQEFKKFNILLNPI